LDTAKPTTATSTATHDEQVVQLFEDARKHLVETGTRNRLIHVNRALTRGPVLNVINERSDFVFHKLSAQESMHFLPRGLDKTDGSPQTSLALPDPVESLDDQRLSDEFLETPLGPDGLQKKLLSIAREARTAEEEQGVNILYLALGFLTWYEDEISKVPRVAPLILLPVELQRNERTSSYDIRMREEDLIANLPLSIRLHDDFCIDLPEVEVDDGWSPKSYFDLVASAIAPWPTWSIDRNVMQLGFFSFSKLLMYQDLSPKAWPDGALKSHALARGLLFEGFADQGMPADLEGPLDAILPPEKLFHVVDADASQAVAIEEARCGRNLVIQGPPGTGKSQTICNIIATAAREGKTVLFVAEKMAALSVVHDRLMKVGLRDICLELHSKAANKKAVIAELSRTLDAAQAVPKVPGKPSELTAIRDRLNAIAELLHHPIGVTDETPITVLARQAQYLGAGHAAPSFTSIALLTMSRAEEDDWCLLIRQYADLVARMGPPSVHPLHALGQLDMQPTDLARGAGFLEQAIAACEALNEACEAAGEAFKQSHAWKWKRYDAELLLVLLRNLTQLPRGSGAAAKACSAASDRKRLLDTLDLGQQWKTATDMARQHFLEPAIEAPILSLRAPLAAGRNSFFARIGHAYKQASMQLGGYLSGTLPKSASARLALVEELLMVQALRRRLGNDEAYCAQCLGTEWRGIQTEFSRLRPAALWLTRVEQTSLPVVVEEAILLAEDEPLLARLIANLERGMSPLTKSLSEAFASLGMNAAEFESSALSEVAGALRQVQASLKDYVSWAGATRLRKRMIAAGFDSIVSRIEEQKLSPHAATGELRFARAEMLWMEARKQFPLLQELDRIDRHDLVRAFAQLERDHLHNNVTQIRARHLAQIPTGAMGEMKVVRGEIGKKRRHLPLRKLINAAPNAIQRIKPVFLMSPLSVAQYLEPGALQFDLLVIDEASQVRPEDALGAVARAKQVVVVGDPRQLPPTSFFDRLLLDDEEEPEPDTDDARATLLGGAARAEELESILTLCEARGLKRKMLKWHYRSKDPSLIEVSNAEFYNNELLLFPSPLKGNLDYGLCFTRVLGVYDRGGKRENRIEAQAVVNRVAEHARKRPERSLGIATFSAAQRNLIDELLELARRTDHDLDEFLREDAREKVFVKNIENVQGDERDVILISVGYGPVEAGGRLSSLSFGPVNSEGGERRLNVLFTRARLRCEVFASFDPDDIDPSRARGAGIRILKRYLDFAKSGRLRQDSPTGEGAENSLEQDIAETIRGLGYLADPQVGSSGFRIDIGVRHPSSPGRYLLAVECDGATYHHALWARERDRMRQEVLEHLGWTFHRIWSTDWFYRRTQEIDRLRTALDQALEEKADSAHDASGHDEHPPSEPDDSITDTVQATESTSAVDRTRKFSLYRRANFTVTTAVELHEADPALLESAVARIVAIEGPIHEEEIARRMAACFGKERAGGRIVSTVFAALMRASRKDPKLSTEGRFWFTHEQREAPVVRDRSQEEGPILKAERISLFEMQAALERARNENGGGTDAELIRAAARYLGFRRVGTDLQQRAQQALSALDAKNPR
jgi:very-short-patch-repair endonuclease